MQIGINLRLTNTHVIDSHDIVTINLELEGGGNISLESNDFMGYILLEY